VPARIFRKSFEAANRLSVLGTSREMLIVVIEAVVAARADCTDNDPFGARGWRGWQMGTRRLREVHVGINNWEKDDTDQVPSILNKRLGIRIVVCNTDDGTAIENGKPQNLSKKGPATGRLIDANQGSFMEQLADSVPIVNLAKRRMRAGNITTHYLCVLAEGDDTRAELSCPVNVENGFFEDFIERIFIVGGDTGAPDPIRRKSDDDGDGPSEYSIPVRRKK
jgi:hypothetical protein